MTLPLSSYAAVERIAQLNEQVASLRAAEAARDADAARHGRLPDRCILWTVLGCVHRPLDTILGIRYALDNGQDDLEPLAPADRRDLAAILEFMVDRIERDGL